MSTELYSMLEPLVVGLVVLAAAIAVLRKQAPGLWKRLTGKTAGGAGCHDDSSGCGSCGSCGSTSSEQPIHIHKANDRVC